MCVVTIWSVCVFACECTYWSDGGDALILVLYRYKGQLPICPVLKHGPRSVLHMRVIECKKLIGVMKVNDAFTVSYVLSLSSDEAHHSPVQ